MSDTAAPPTEGESDDTTASEAGVADVETAPEPARTEPSPGNDNATTETAETTDPDADPDAEPQGSFDDFNLSEPLRRALVDVGYEAPMQVQTAVFEQLAAGRDVQVESRTGSGKTAAFGIPMIEKLQGQGRGLSAMILAPTRELAKQVADEITRLSVHTDVDVCAIYGGAAMGPQVSALKDGVRIVAGTPGRVLDHLRRRTLDPRGISMLVLDECDEMLSMGFQEEIENIIGFLPAKEDRQTLLFSATIPDDIKRIASRHLTDPVTISLSKDGIGATEIDHHYYLVTGMARARDLLKVVLAEKPERALIFCNTRDDTATVARYLAKKGFDAEAISGDLSQRERERVLSRMRDQTLRFLVATDVAARGIDISDISHVINYQFPESAEVYVHRTGRTGRAGKTGIALSLVGPRELGSFYYLKLIYKIRPEERDLPPSEELSTMLENHQLDRINKLVTEKPNEKFVSLAKRVWESDDGGRIIGALLERLLVAETSVERDRAEKREREREFGREDSGRGRSSRSDRGGRGGRGGRDRDRDRDRDDAPKRRRRRSESAEASADGAEASPETEETLTATSEATTDGAEATEAKATEAKATEAKATDGEATEARSDSDVSADGDAEDGAPKKRRRRRRRRGGGGGERGERSGSERSERNGGERKAAAADDGREFWETWADEKGEDNGAKDNGGKENGAPDGEGRETSDAKDTRDPVDDGPPSTRLYVNIGKREEVTTEDIRELIAGFIGDGGAEKIASIALRNTHCYVRVPDEVVQTIIDASEGQEYRERELLIEKARR